MNTTIMSTREILEEAIRQNPQDVAAWAALKDWHIEQGRSDIPWKIERFPEVAKSQSRPFPCRFATRIGNVYYNPECIRLTMDTWMHSGPRWMHWYPMLKRIRIVDKKPDAFPGLHLKKKYIGVWFSNENRLSYPPENCRIPEEIHDLMRKDLISIKTVSKAGGMYYENFKAARLALSEACILWAKQKAGLVSL